MRVQIILAGVGGQGVLFATRVFAQMAMAKGFPVIGSETHGMSQRGENPGSEENSLPAHSGQDYLHPHGSITFTGLCRRGPSRLGWQCAPLGCEMF